MALSLVQKLAHQVRVPASGDFSGDRIYKDECVFSFDNPESEGGLYVCLNTFLGFGRKFVERHFQKTGNGLYLHLKTIKHKIPAEKTAAAQDEAKVTRLAIGLEGGFSGHGSAKYEYEETNSLAILPEFLMIPLPNPDLPEHVQVAIGMILAADSASKLEEALALTGTWDGEKRKISRHANNLRQDNNGVTIPPRGWKCEACDKTDNLWLNLTDGSILCGRRFFDGTGGNNHALEHFLRNGFPLAVKLGTITPVGADVFSYEEDEMVEDPLLVHHLAHFGINIAQMEKTDKSMTELEIDINQRLGEWSTIQESGSQLTPLYGPGYTGLVNLGNSCYLNSIMQVLFSIPDFQDRYFKEADAIFESAPQDPTGDFSVQMAKLAYGLLSGEYSRPPAKACGSETDADESQPGIKPTMFKWLIGKGHPEFSTKRQQDAQEFYLHLVNVLERNNRNRPNPADCFKFREEDRTVCTASKRVKYMHNTQFALRLPIPVEHASRDGKAATSSSRDDETHGESSKPNPKETVRPRVPLSACLEAYACEKVVPDFYSTAIGQKTTALRSPRMATFPDYLMIHLEKFTFENGWIPKKLDVSVEVPDELDLSFLKGCGLQPNEEELPEENAAIPTHLAAPVAINKEVVSQLAEMGFPFEACRKAVYNTGNQGVEAASGWIMEHMGDPDFAEPLAGLEAASSAPFEPDTDALQTIMGMGFSHEQAVKALKATDNNIERAVDWIFSHADELTGGANMEVDQASDSHSTFRDGAPKYRLMAFVSHMGTSTMVGHYVCHIVKDGRWAIYNDNKVAVSENPPKDLGYLYFYKRISD